MTSLSDKTVLITGGSRGIGRAAALAFAGAGARVAVHYHQQQATAQAVCDSLPGSGHMIVQANIADAAAVEHMVSDVVSAFDRLDIVVNNAGIFEDHPLAGVNYPDWQTAWQKTLGVNLVGAANVAYCVARHMIERGQGGRIVNVTSRGAFRGEPLSPAYGASKAGLNAMSQSLAQHLAPHLCTRQKMEANNFPINELSV